MLVAVLIWQNNRHAVVADSMDTQFNTFNLTYPVKYIRAEYIGRGTRIDLFFQFFAGDDRTRDITLIIGEITDNLLTLGKSPGFGHFPVQGGRPSSFGISFKCSEEKPKQREKNKSKKEILQLLCLLKLLNNIIYYPYIGCIIGFYSCAAKYLWNIRLYD
ncbi:hypothetical protein TRIP_C50007 [Candidatus Zixiibacteriota bacterium]|nr:hypothetical protein TRIP_C50007 [candidate division Zixibacteria bacterium]